MSTYASRQFYSASDQGDISDILRIMLPYARIPSDVLSDAASSLQDFGFVHQPSHSNTETGLYVEPLCQEIPEEKRDPYNPQFTCEFVQPPVGPDGENNSPAIMVSETMLHHGLGYSFTFSVVSFGPAYDQLDIVAENFLHNIHFTSKKNEIKGNEYSVSAFGLKGADLRRAMTEVTNYMIELENARQSAEAQPDAKTTEQEDQGFRFSPRICPEDYAAQLLQRNAVFDRYFTDTLNSPQEGLDISSEIKSRFLGSNEKGSVYGPSVVHNLSKEVLYEGIKRRLVVEVESYIPSTSASLEELAEVPIEHEYSISLYNIEEDGALVECEYSQKQPKKETNQLTIFVEVAGAIRGDQLVNLFPPLPPHPVGMD